MALKVLIVSHAYMEGENQKNVEALATFLDIDVATPKTMPSPLFGSYEYRPYSKVGQIVRPLPILRMSHGQYIFLSLRLAKYGFIPDIILIEYNPWSLMFVQALLCRSLFFPRSKLVCFVKKNTYRERGRAFRWLVRLLINRTDYFICASTKAAKMLSSVGVRDVQNVSVEHHLGVDTRVFAPVAAGGGDSKVGNLAIGYCGRFDEDKGVLELVDCVREVRMRTGESIELKLLGRGALSHHLEKLSAGERWIQICAPVPPIEVIPFLQGLDIFVLAAKALPDHEEHDAHALLEALACGLPCVATDVGVVADIIASDNGILVPRDRYDLVTKTLIELVMDTQKRKTLGRRARNMAIQEFSVEAVARRKAAILERVGAK